MNIQSKYMYIAMNCSVFNLLFFVIFFFLLFGCHSQSKYFEWVRSMAIRTTLVCAHKTLLALNSVIWYEYWYCNLFNTVYGVGSPTIQINMTYQSHITNTKKLKIYNWNRIEWITILIFISNDRIWGAKFSVCVIISKWMFRFDKQHSIVQ